MWGRAECSRTDGAGGALTAGVRERGTIGEPYANREDRSRGVNLLEAKARVVRVFAEQLIRQPRALLDTLR